MKHLPLTLLLIVVMCVMLVASTVSHNPAWVCVAIGALLGHVITVVSELLQKP